MAIILSASYFSEINLNIKSLSSGNLGSIKIITVKSPLKTDEVISCSCISKA